MRRRTAAIAAFITAAAIAIFLLAPVVYSPMQAWAGGPANRHKVSIAAYESPSCALLGVGAGIVNQTAAIGLTTVFGYHALGKLGPWSYYLVCPPSVIPPPSH